MALVAADNVNVEENATLEGLAEKWESSFEIRKKARRNGALVEWPNADAAGIPSMILICIKLWGSHNLVQHLYIPWIPLVII